jgi:hypothetical protein
MSNNDFNRLQKECFVHDFIKDKRPLKNFHMQTYEGHHGYDYLWRLYGKLKHNTIFKDSNIEETIEQYYEMKAEEVLLETL